MYVYKGRIRNVLNEERDYHMVTETDSLQTAIHLFTKEFMDPNNIGHLVNFEKVLDDVILLPTKEIL